MSRIATVLRLSFVFVLLLLVPAAARAQSRAFATGLGGMTFDTASNLDLAGRAGVKLSPHVQVFGETGRMSSVLPKADRQAVEQATTALAATEIDGAPFVFGEVPMIYGLGGVRVTSSPMARFTPYAEGTFGVAHLRDNVSATVDGADVLSQVATPLLAALPENDHLLGVGGGVSVLGGKHTAFEVGYRYSRVFAPEHAINTGKVDAGIRFNF